MVTDFANPPSPPFRKGGLGGILSEFLFGSDSAGLGFTAVGFGGLNSRGESRQLRTGLNGSFSPNAMDGRGKFP
jgi:hypothetical protein